MGANPVKPKNEEGSKEFAELFNLADSKIKDRAHEKPRYDLSYNPIQLQQQQMGPPSQPSQSQPIINDAFSNMTLGNPQPPV